MSSEQIVPILAGQTPGLVVIVIFASLSVFALSFLAFRAIWLLASPLLRRNGSQDVSTEHVFFHTQLGHYAACLLAGNFFTSAAGVVVARWASQGSLQEGTACTTQAILMQIGNFATAYFTVVIAIHTCSTLVFRFRQTVWVGATVVAVGWASSLVIGFAPLKMSGSGSGSTYGFDGFSCGIKRVFSVPQFLFHLLPIFFAAVVSAVIYSLIFLVLRGTLVVKGGFKLNLDPNERWNGKKNSLEEYHRFILAIARSMLWYPFAYIVLLLPYSVTKLLDLSGYPVAFGGKVFAETCSFMLGLVNVCLIHNTFRVLEPAFEARSTPSSTRKSDLESYDEPSEKMAPHPAMAAVNQTLKKFAIAKPAQDGLLPSWKFPTRSLSSSKGRNLTRHKSNSSVSSNSSLRLFIPAHDGYTGQHTRVGSLSQASVSNESIGRSITPMSDLNNALLTTPEASMQKASLGMPNARYQQDGVRGSSMDSLSLPPPPRNTRSPVQRRPSMETIKSASPRKDQWSTVDLRQGSSSAGLTRGSSVSSVSSSQRGSFGVRRMPSPATEHARRESEATFRSMKKQPMSDLQVSMNVVASNVMPAPTPSPPSEYGSGSSDSMSPPMISSRQSVPTDVDEDDQIPVSAVRRTNSNSLRQELRSRTETTAPEALNSLASLSANPTTSNGFLPVPQSALPRDDSLLQAQYPRTPISARPRYNGVIDTAVHGRNRSGGSVSSVISGDFGAQTREGPSRMASPSTSRRAEFVRTPSSSTSQQHYF